MIVSQNISIDPDSPINRNLVAWWLADNLAGGRWRDMRKGYVTTASSAPYRQGAHGRRHGRASVFFDGTDDYHSTPNHADWGAGLTRLTAAMWLRPTASDTNQRTFLMKGLYGSPYDWTFAYQWTPTFGNVRCFVVNGGGDNGTNFYDTSSGGVTANVWQHVIVVYDGTQGTAGNRIRVYLNGNLMTGSATGTLPTALYNLGDTHPLHLGFFNGLGRYFLGQMDDVRIWHRAPPAEEAKQIYLDAVGGYRDTLLRPEAPCWVEPAAAPGGLAIPIAAYHYNHHLGSMAG